MTAYVDALVVYPGAPRALRSGSCHLLADSDVELEVFARKLGLRREWKHVDHYDLSATRRAHAVALGAREITRRQMVEIRRALRLNHAGA